MPTEKYAHAPEILEHCQRIGKQFGLYEHALFHTEVTDLEWDAEASRWIVRTTRGDEFTAQFLAMGTGPLHVPKLPGIPGIESSAATFHTSRWDYGYTGGDSDGAPMDKLGDKRRHRRHVPPQCSASPTSPRRAASCTCSNGPRRRSTSATTGPPTRTGSPRSHPGWQQRWLENFTANQTGVMVDEDLVQDG